MSKIRIAFPDTTPTLVYAASFNHAPTNSRGYLTGNARLIVGLDDFVKTLTELALQLEIPPLDPWRLRTALDYARRRCKYATIENSVLLMEDPKGSFSERHLENMPVNPHGTLTA